ncbi:MAG: hypothetical protein P4L76_15330 [Beijerinckiaceae bacterium]|nr:hypothetical protein [Beijerinckiaceae bacterium]
MTISPTRTRVRRYIPIFETCPELTAQQCWIDRVKFSIPSLIVSPTSQDDLFPGLKRRALERNGSFRVARRGAQIIIEFRNDWQFGLKLYLSFVDGTWKASGSLDLNAMRLFGASGGEGLSVVDPTFLRKEPPTVFTTLDNNDNFVPDEHLRLATVCKWPAYFASYVDAVCSVVANELSHEFGRGSCFISLGTPGLWSLSAAELCFEFYVENAIEKMATIASASRALASDFAETEYALSYSTVVTHGHREWAPFVQFGAGSKLVDEAVYAKAFDRLRLEIRYKRHPTRAIRINKSAIAGEDDYLVQLFTALSENATARANRFLKAYRRSVSGTEANLVPLVTALYQISRTMTGRLQDTNKILTQLIQHGGISHSTDPDVQSAITELVRNNVLMPSDLSLRPNRRRYILKPRYSHVFEVLRDSGLGLSKPTHLR